jgi:RNA polymerase sigma-70 factor, ECF subfamily
MPISHVVEQARNGDMAAFEKLYYLYKRQVYALCFRMTKDVFDSEDLTQEVFLQVYRKVSGFRGEAAFGTWLYRVTFNIVMMHLRRRRMEAPPLSLSELKNHPNGMPPSLRSQTCRGPLACLALKEAIDDLADGRRTVVIMHDVQGLTHREIGLRLGIKDGTSKSRLHQARRKLKNLLANAASSS